MLPNFWGSNLKVGRILYNQRDLSASEIAAAHGVHGDVLRRARSAAVCLAVLIGRQHRGRHDRHDGLLHGHGTGSTLVTATANGLSDVARVSVVQTADLTPHAVWMRSPPGDKSEPPSRSAPPVVEPERCDHELRLDVPGRRHGDRRAAGPGLLRARLLLGHRDGEGRGRQAGVVHGRL